MYQNEGESRGKRIAFDKHDVGKVNVETSLLSCYPNRIQGEAFQVAQEFNIRNWAILRVKAASGIRQNKAGDWQILRQFCIPMDHMQSLSTLCVHIDGAHSLTFVNFSEYRS